MMATKLANAMGPNGMHTAGIFADMTVDGPEIGTLVVIVDRAKNLPNRKAMGKQNPYCAARLGKEAKKTETDKRGGQTPKWDQEMRFTVHDSPDYHNLKISVFSEDKRTELIGEAWASLKEVVVPGGGKSDLWQGLNCKGKYAGEIRVELTYYDSRPKPERSRAESSVGEEELGLRQSVSGGSKVKRRPLPSNPNSRGVTPDTIPEPVVPGRAKHGPRDYRTPPRATSMPPENTSDPPPQSVYEPQASEPSRHHSAAPQPHYQETQPDTYYDEPQQFYQEEEAYSDPYQQPDFLPQLPPSNRQRAVPQQRYGSSQVQPLPSQPRPHSHIGLAHSQSAPMVPTAHAEPETYDNGAHLRTDYPEPIPDIEYQHRQLRQRRNDVPPGWQEEYGDPFAQMHPGFHGEDDGPPPPPMHSNSAPVVPQYAHRSTPPSSYGNTSPSARHNSVPNASPLQTVERSYGQPHRVPVQGQPGRGRSTDSYASSSEQSPYGNAVPSGSLGQASSPYTRKPTGRALPSRHSVADPYGNTPPRPHPLSQEVPRARSPRPPMEFSGSTPPSHDPSQYPYDHRSRSPAPLIKPRPVSPQPPSQAQAGFQPKSTYSLRFPVRAFASSDNSPLSTSQSPNGRASQAAGSTPPTRKSVSPRPSPPESRGSSVPFSPDSFDVHNPNARPSSMGVSPHTPYQVRPGSSDNRDQPKGPIVGWHGQEIDPSDHLPVDSWAPEPEKKTPTKTYGLGRDRDFGPRSGHGTPTSGGRISKDTVVNVRMKQPSTESEPSSAGRNRLVKKNGGPGRSPIVEPLREHHNYNSVPDPYAQQDYSSGFRHGNPVYGAPNLPPKVPFQQDMGADELTREISSIDIGSGRYGRPNNGSVPAPTAYVPVRSHRDRNSYY